MQSVILTIVFLATPAGSAQQTTTMEVRDMATCEAVAETWRRWPGGLLEVKSATCVVEGVGTELRVPIGPGSSPSQ